MSKSLITLLNESSRAVATIASVVTLTFVMLILAPTVAAAQDAADEAANEALIAGSEERQLSTAIAKVKRTLEKLQSKLDKNEDGTLEKNELKQLENSVRQLDHTVTQRFDQIGQHIQANNLDPVIEQRQADMVATYRTEFDALVANLANLDSSDASVVVQAVADALAQLNQFTLERPHQPVVPGQFSNFSVEPDFENKPKETETDFTRAGYFDNPYLQLAALGDFTFDRLPGADNPAYLAETDEVRITDAVRAKAAELDNDPVKIYYWVRNNVEWLPTWGAIQDADITLGSLRGNAIDISSLLIALYRASGIPARYVHGTIEVPQDQFDNWTGNFTDSQAALSFASSGGIPLRQYTLTDGETTTTTVRMEHIWVEAALDYFPSRAAVNKDADSWMKLDASFKQYEKKQALDVIAIAGLDPNQIAQDLMDSGTMNETEGWVQGIDKSIIQDVYTQVQTGLETYIENQLEDSIVGDVVGLRKTIIKEYPAIPSSTETKVLAIGVRYSSIPDLLAPNITFAFSTDIIGLPNDPTSFRWSKLNNRKVTLSFKPATQADEDALNSLIPADAIGPNDLPNSIPSYLIKVVPELKIEGVTVKTGSPRTLGEELLLYNEIQEPNRPAFIDQRSIIVGSYVSFSVIGGSVSRLRLQELQAEIEVTKNKLQSADNSVISEISKEDLLGTTYYVGSLGYFAQYQAISTITMMAMEGQFGLPLSAGVLGYEPNVSMFFGMPRAVESGSISLDLHRVSRQLGIADLSPESRVKTALRIGMLSSVLESIVPDQLQLNHNPSAEGVSSVSALGKANDAGQRVYSVSSQNIVDVLPQISLNSEVEAEIQQYVNAGFRATIHTHDVTFPGWKGAGYVLFDEGSGAASYKITGGKNGGVSAMSETASKVLNISSLFVGVLNLKQVLDLWTELHNDLGSFAVIAEFVAGLLDIIANCPPDIAIWTIIFYSMAAIFAVYLVIQLTAFGFGFFWGWFISNILSYVVNGFRSTLMNLGGCRQE